MYEQPINHISLKKKKRPRHYVHVSANTRYVTDIICCPSNIQKCYSNISSTVVYLSHWLCIHPMPKCKMGTPGRNITISGLVILGLYIDTKVVKDSSDEYYWLLHIDKLNFKSKLHTRYLRGLVLCIMAASDNYFHTYLQFFFHEFVKLWHPAEGEVTVGQEHPVTLHGKTTVMLKSSVTHSLAWAKANSHFIVLHE